jgi:uncharacterized membrane protein YfcA
VISDDFLLFVAVGLAAQLIDGAIGMAYGVTSTSVMLSLGVPPVTASACVHAAEIFTTGASGLAHWKLGNVDRKLVARLALPGMIGGALGAYVLTGIDGERIKPFISAYLIVLGAVIVWKAIRKPPADTAPPRRIGPLGFFGGLLDSIGGGGWGAIVTSNLIGQGTAPRFAIGSVNLAEFFVTATISATFVATVGLDMWPMIAGLVTGGVLAAPLAALATKHVPDRALMAIVGSVVVVLSLRGVLKSAPAFWADAQTLLASLM